jgi:hypothetical protein
MKSVRQKASDLAPDDDAGNPSGPDTPAEDQPGPTEPGTAAMPRTSHRNRNAEVDVRGETRSNATQTSTTDPMPGLARNPPGTGAMPCFMGHALMDAAGAAIGPESPPQGSGRSCRAI